MKKFFKYLEDFFGIVIDNQHIYGVLLDKEIGCLKSYKEFADPNGYCEYRGLLWVVKDEGKQYFGFVLSYSESSGGNCYNFLTPYSYKKIEDVPADFFPSEENILPKFTI